MNPLAVPLLWVSGVALFAVSSLALLMKLLAESNALGDGAPGAMVAWCLIVGGWTLLCLAMGVAGANKDAGERDE